MNRRPHILIIGANPWNIGGIQKHIGEIMKYCNVYNIVKITLYTTTTNDTEVGLQYWHNNPVKIFKRMRHFPYVPKDLYENIKNNEKYFDLIHIHGTGSIEPLLTLLAVKNTPICITPHYHPIGSNRHLEIIRKVCGTFITKYILQRVKKIICVSEIEKQLLLARFGEHLRNKIIVIPNGIDYDKIYDAKPYVFDGNLILYVGRIEQHKNIDIIIQTMKYLPDSFYFYIIGDGSSKSQLIEMIYKFKLEKRIKILSSISDEKVCRWYKTCDIFITMSNIEAFGITVIEALAAGKPVIVNDKLALAEHAKNFKDAVYPVDVSNIKLERLAEIIQEISNKNPSVDLNRYYWSNIANQIQMIYCDQSKEID